MTKSLLLARKFDLSLLPIPYVLRTEQLCWLTDFLLLNLWVRSLVCVFVRSRYVRIYCLFTTIRARRTKNTIYCKFCPYYRTWLRWSLGRACKWSNKPLPACPWCGRCRGSCFNRWTSLALQSNLDTLYHARFYLNWASKQYEHIQFQFFFKVNEIQLTTKYYTCWLYVWAVVPCYS